MPFDTRYEPVALMQFDVDTVNWTPWVAPIDANHAVLYNPTINAVKIRSNETLATTEETIPPGSQYQMMQFMDPHIVSNEGRFRFNKGSTILWVQGTVGTQTLKGQLIR